MNAITRFAAICVLSHAALAPADAAGSTAEELRASFERFVEVQNAHDAGALAEVLADSPEFLWITRGMVIWGREAALQRFAKLHEGTWRLEPDMAALRVVAMGPGVAQLHVPVTFTTGARDQPPQKTRMFINQVWTRSGGKWRLMSIFPVPAPAPAS